jgi:hypothetical protein
MTRSRTVAILALPGVQLLVVSGPLDVFAESSGRRDRLCECRQLALFGHAETA